MHVQCAVVQALLQLKPNRRHTPAAVGLRFSVPQVARMRGEDRRSYSVAAAARGARAVSAGETARRDVERCAGRTARAPVRGHPPL